MHCLEIIKERNIVAGIRPTLERGFGRQRRDMAACQELSDYLEYLRSIHAPLVKVEGENIS